MKTLKMAQKLFNDYSELLVEVNSIRASLGLLNLEDKRSPETAALIHPPASKSVTPLQVTVSDTPGGPPALECLKSPQHSYIHQEHVAAWLSSLHQNDPCWTKQCGSEFGELNELLQTDLRNGTSCYAI
uniref:C4H2-type domain-containing protein n=1 Tax=Mesocestoides corti TaxID=53468 RepID=A0A5K3FKC7_MESCO